ncbi:hypothetical protein Tcan_08761 [Toxocara canis]|uniref:Uncharacterized protein n=1 Tax=Toxocara canis TaxID=6265 RepID=A0A0B2UZP7_TOXCA|nr:hypothetical protein Tcan_08761 [Toxocara canis]
MSTSSAVPWLFLLYVIDLFDCLPIGIKANSYVDYLKTYAKWLIHADDRIVFQQALGQLLDNEVEVNRKTMKQSVSKRMSHVLELLLFRRHCYFQNICAASLKKLFWRSARHHFLTKNNTNRAYRSLDE